MPREVYRHVPDLSWSGWSKVARTFYTRLRVPATVEEVVGWDLGPELVDDGREASAARRASYARNVLAWLSLRGRVDCVGGKWRRINS